MSNGPFTPTLEQDADGRWFDNYIDQSDPPTPLFRFGAGETYSSFAYSNIKTSVATDASNNVVPVKLHVDLTNTGRVEAAEVVQVYCRDPVGTSSNVVRYWKRLTAFQRVPLAAGAKQTVVIDLLADELGSHDDAMVFRITPGVYNCSVGGSSVTDSLYTAFTIVAEDGSTATPPAWSVPNHGQLLAQLAEKDTKIAELEQLLLSHQRID